MCEKKIQPFRRSPKRKKERVGKKKRNQETKPNLKGGKKGQNYNGKSQKTTDFNKSIKKGAKEEKGRKGGDQQKEREDRIEEKKKGGGFAHKQKRKQVKSVES